MNAKTASAVIGGLAAAVLVGACATQDTMRPTPAARFESEREYNILTGNWEWTAPPNRAPKNAGAHTMPGPYY